MNKPLAEVRYLCGRGFLSVAGVCVAMQGDACRDGDFPDEVYDPIPADELERATIGGQRASEMPVKVVRFFRGDQWTIKMLEFAAAKINEWNAMP